MARISPDVEQFVAEHFDSEEAIMLVVVLRQDSRDLSLATLFDRLDEQFSIGGSEDRRLAEKRLELRLRDLVSKRLVSRSDDGTYRYSPSDRDADALLQKTIAAFTENRGDVNRVIYSTSSRARRLAEAFKI